MHKTKTFKFKSFNGYEHNPTLTRESALIIGAELIAWSQSPEEKETKPPAEPRLWVGKATEADHWWWMPEDMLWELANIEAELEYGLIFASPTGSSPVVNPTKLDSLPLCREVDWEVE